MTLEEAVKELITNDIRWAIEEIENHEDFEEEELEEWQIEEYESYKKKLEAFRIVLGKINPEFSTDEEGFIKKCKEVIREIYGEEEPNEEPSEIEVELYELLKGKGDFRLPNEDNLILAKINMEDGKKRVLIDEDPEDAEDPSEDDVFDFYSYRGKVFVGYNGYADGSFSSYPLRFQEKALELIKQRI